MHRVKYCSRKIRSSGLRLAGSDDGGITFLEVLVTFIMIAVATVVVGHSLYFGNRMLDVDMHKQQALRIVQQELEYWIGRLYMGSPGDPSEFEMAPKMNYKSVILEKDTPPITVQLSRDQILPVMDPNTAAIAYWKVTVWAEWEEPDGQLFSREIGTEVSLTTYVSVPYSE